MAGIYIHVPFCKTRCIYCDFYSTTNNGWVEAFVNALLKEISLRQHDTSETIDTIYFGGGTPSQLTVSHIQLILNRITSLFDVNPEAEITVEVNPDDTSEDYFCQLHHIGVNRISMGIQSFDDSELRFLSRRHNAQAAIDAVRWCKQAGFSNISIDLMYGLPNQTMKVWQNNLHQAIALDVPHISAYHLIYEEKTKLYRLLEKNAITPVSDDRSIEMFSELITTLKKQGYEHYEISNFAKNGLYSKHNTAYWQQKVYLGFGPAAHSFDGNQRMWNVSSIKEYVESISAGSPNTEMEQLSSTDKYNERILTGIRTMWGVDLVRLEQEFGREKLDYCLQNAYKHINNNVLCICNNHLKLTPQGIFISDGIMSDLMYIDS